MLIDSHCHLNCLNDNNLEIILEDAEKNNVKIINNICTSIEEFNDILNLSLKYKNVFCSVGHHPEYSKIPVKIEDFSNIIKNDKVIAIGEAGLDYHFTKDFKKEQKLNFEIQIELARKNNLPLIIHSRDSDNDMIDILENEVKNGKFEFILHSFSSSKKLAYKALDLDGYISFSGILTFKNAIELQNIAKCIPLNKIILETDSPYLAPVPHRGKQNQPSYVIEISRFLANLLNIDNSIIEEKTTENCFKIFKYKKELLNF